MPLEFPISFSRLPSTEGPYHFVGEWVGRRSADITWLQVSGQNHNKYEIFAVLVVPVLCWKGCNLPRLALLDLRIWSIYFDLMFPLPRFSNIVSHQLEHFGARGFSVMDGATSTLKLILLWYLYHFVSICIPRTDDRIVVMWIHFLLRIWAECDAAKNVRRPRCGTTTSNVVRTPSCSVPVKSSQESRAIPRHSLLLSKCWGTAEPQHMLESAPWLAVCIRCLESHELFSNSHYRSKSRRCCL